MLMVKSLHVLLAYITVMGFIARFFMHFACWSVARSRWLKVLPHLVDSLLLILGVSMAYQMGISPLGQDWLMAKLVGLLAYIVFGVMALRGTNEKLRWIGFVAALASVCYIFAVACTKQIWPVTILL
ncbi:MAG: SirB2 family protein [Pseudomonadales bacterium]|nr:SirB2 family protein [Pseudomonadales bacterium]